MTNADDLTRSFENKAGYLKYSGEIVIYGGTVIDELGYRQVDVVIEDGKIKQLVEPSDLVPKSLKLDATGCWVTPGLVDLHAHLREPGFEDSECIETGSTAAALGGYTAVVAMPNTEPCVDNASVVRDIQKIAATALIEVLPAGAITKSRQGETLSPMAEMAELGVRIFTDDGAGIQDGHVMRMAMEYASGLSGGLANDNGIVLASHAEDTSLSANGQMHEGIWSSKLGIPGILTQAEDVMVYRDISLAKLTGARLHLMHISTAESVRLLALAKAEGFWVTGEVTPHHLTLTDEELKSFDPTMKVKPPLRSSDIQQSLKDALYHGIVDAVATDHAPWSKQFKECAFQDAAFGISGLETALSVMLSSFCQTEQPKNVAQSNTGRLTPQELIGLMSSKPARIAGVYPRHGGPIQKGAVANLCVIDPNFEWVVNPEEMASRSTNTPWLKKKLKGKIRHTIFQGVPVVMDMVAQR
ncbi:MAG: dihydroorotase [Actinobacteria bacterium]|nr:dihydroorotase [Actinomycetota bacterium]MCL6104131.1 dihydroorotase [Actinomycetota bacterium]